MWAVYAIKNAEGEQLADGIAPEYVNKLLDGYFDSVYLGCYEEPDEWKNAVKEFVLDALSKFNEFARKQALESTIIAVTNLKRIYFFKNNALKELLV